MPLENSKNIVYWFYVIAPRQIWRIESNFYGWAWRFFSIGFLSRRLFSPWHRDLTSYGRGFDFKRFFRILGWNLISRVIGAILRVFVVLLGILVLIGLVIVGVLMMIFWIFLPVFVLFFLIAGLFMIIS